MGVRTAVSLTLSAILGAGALTGVAASTAANAVDLCPLPVAASGGGDSSGGSYPQESMAAFKRSIAAGVGTLHANVRYTKDNQLVVFADERLDRLTSSSGKVSDLTLAELRQVKLKNGEPIPTLFDFLKLLEQTRSKAVAQYDDKTGDAFLRKLFTVLSDSDAAVSVMAGREVLGYADANDYALPLIWAPPPQQGNPTDGKKTEETISGGGTQPVTVKPWPKPNDLVRGADVAMVADKITEDWVTLMRGVDAEVLAYFDGSGDSPDTWAKLAKWKVRWIATSDVAGFQSWNASGGGGACAPQPPREQFVKCFDLAKEPLPRKSRTVVLKKGCQTTGLQPISVKLEAKKSVAKLIQRKGKYVVKTFNKKGKVKITLSSPAQNGYLAYETVHPRTVR